MEKYTLFMLNPWYEADGKGPYYCPDCGVIEGFLAYSPEIRNKIKIISVNFLKPRNEIVSHLGLENQDCPVLIFDDEALIPDGTQQSMSTGKNFINDSIEICNFLGETFNGVKPHP